MSVTTQFSFQLVNNNRKNILCSACSHILRSFDLNGHFNYAFIYGTWEIIRARKVGTTHTKVDYVVYRLFYPVVLIGACLFSAVAENELGKFFCLMEVWSIILHISYAFIFLQNVLSNNLHREPVRGRQKIPERLIVTDEIEKGGHKLYICKRYSILPTDNLYYTERLIWLMFNMLASVNVAIWLGHAFRTIKLTFPTIGVAYRHSESLERIRTMCIGILALADVILTPIPMRLVHVVYPISYMIIYSTFLYILYVTRGIVLYTYVDWRQDPSFALNTIVIRLICVIILHGILCGISKVRDHIVSILDDSRTAKQMQNLRSQKRLARRKLMNHVQGPDGRIIGITLEKHSHVPTTDEFIKTDKDQKRTVDINGLESSTSDEDGNENQEKPKSKLPEEIENMVPITNKVKPPPNPRYAIPVLPDLGFSSSSSSSDFKKDLEAIQDVRLPTPPKPGKLAKSTKPQALQEHPRLSKIPVPIHKLGLQVKPRDSKEQIHQRMSIDRQRSQSPPTPPLIKLVEKMVKIRQDKKQEEQELQNQLKKRSSFIPDPAFISIIRTSEKPKKTDEMDTYVPAKLHESHRKKVHKHGHWRRVSSTIGPRMNDRDDIYYDMNRRNPVKQGKGRGYLDSTMRRQEGNQFDKGGPGDRPKAAKVISLPGNMQKSKENDFRSELATKLQREHDLRQGMGDVPPGGAGRPTHNKKHTEQSPHHHKEKGNNKNLGKLRSILKHGDGEKRESKVNKRSVKIAKRRAERVLMGKQGKPVYDPLAVPDINQTTSFHYLGTRLKGEKAERNMLRTDDMHIYRSHPGIAPIDDGDGAAGETEPAMLAKSLITFHPIVRYFDVNEVKQDTEKGTSKRKSTK